MAKSLLKRNREADFQVRPTRRESLHSQLYCVSMQTYDSFQFILLFRLYLHHLNCWLRSSSLTNVLLAWRTAYYRKQMMTVIKAITHLKVVQSADNLLNISSLYRCLNLYWISIGMLSVLLLWE